MHILIKKLTTKQGLEWLCVHFFFLKYEKITLNVVIQFIHQNGIICNAVLYPLKALRFLLVWQNLW